MEEPKGFFFFFFKGMDVISQMFGIEVILPKSSKQNFLMTWVFGYHVTK